MFQPDEEYVVSTVEKSVEMVLEEDEVLFRRGVSEWTVAHRLAVYLERFYADFAGWVVDCEFNRQPFDERSSEFSPNQTKKVNERTKRPDIVIHKRADPDAEIEGDNLLAIEMKVNEPTDNSNEENDITDIENIREDKGYEYGVFINFYDYPTELDEWDSSYLEWRPEQLNDLE